MQLMHKKTDKTKQNLEDLSTYLDCLCSSKKATCEQRKTLVICKFRFHIQNEDDFGLLLFCIALEYLRDLNYES